MLLFGDAINSVRSSLLAQLPDILHQGKIAVVSSFLNFVQCSFHINLLTDSLFFSFRTESCLKNPAVN
jgi:hypothetical protein